MTASHVPAVSEPADKRPITISARISRSPLTTGSSIRPAWASCRPTSSAPRWPSSAPASAGMVAAFELMKMGLKPVIYEAGRIGGRLRSVPFEGAEGIIAELGGMRFPTCSTAFYHYLDQVGLETEPFPNPLAPASPSTVIDLEGQPLYAEKPEDLPQIFQEVAAAWNEALEHGAQFSAMQDAIRARDVRRIKEIWNRLIPIWDDRSFYGFVATSDAFSGGRSATARSSARSASAPAAGIPTSRTRCWRSCASSTPTATRTSAWSWAASSRCRAGCGRCRPTRWRIGRAAPRWRRCMPARRGRASPGSHQPPAAASPSPTAGARPGNFDAVLVTCQTWLLTTHIEVEERLFSQKLWMALDRTRYMQSAKTFVMVDRPFWKDKDPKTGRDVMSMTLSDRLTRGTYLFDNGAGQAGRHLPVLFLDGRRAEAAAAAGREAGEADARRAEAGLSRRRHRQPHHRRSDHGLLGVRPQFPRRLQGRPARPLPL